MLKPPMTTAANMSALSIHKLPVGLDSPIGIFDSGVGGLSVYQHLQNILPHKRFIYYADSRHIPYGNKSADTIIDLTTKAVAWLIDKGCKLVVIACNSASAYALKHLRQRFGVPIVGLVPAIKPACHLTKSHKVALLATLATIQGAPLARVIDQYATPCQIEVLTHFEPQLVTWVESGMPTDHDVAHLLIKQMYTWIGEGVDVLVLGCTHYPFFRTFLQQEIDKNQLNMTLIDSGYAIALRVKSLIDELDNEPINNKPTNKPINNPPKTTNHTSDLGLPNLLFFYSSAFDNADTFAHMCRRIRQISQQLIATPIQFISRQGDYL